MTVPDSLSPAPDAPAPWQMTLAEFSRAYKPVRCFQRYTPEQRANHAASHRLGYLKQQAVGEYYYVHPLQPDFAYPSPSKARWIVHWNFVEHALQQGRPVPADVLADYPPSLWREYRPLTPPPDGTSSDTPRRPAAGRAVHADGSPTAPP